MLRKVFYLSRFLLCLQMSTRLRKTVTRACWLELQTRVTLKSDQAWIMTAKAGPDTVTSGSWAFSPMEGDLLWTASFSILWEDARAWAYKTLLSFAWYPRVSSCVHHTSTLVPKDLALYLLPSARTSTLDQMEFSLVFPTIGQRPWRQGSERFVSIFLH